MPGVGGREWIGFRPPSLPALNAKHDDDVNDERFNDDKNKGRGAM